jgi:phenylalanine-4-hydroxylase
MPNRILELNQKDITVLGLDHPGANDLQYRKRRDFISSLANRAHTQNFIPTLEYTEEEHGVWKIVNQNLAPLHKRHASRKYLQAKDSLQIPSDSIPQLNDLSRSLSVLSGFRLEPIEGLVDSRSFLGKFAENVMWCTQYIRHSSRPEYTPEPDVLHEIIGHVPTLLDPVFVELSQLLGKMAISASDEELLEVERMYWYTIEFGLIREDGAVKAYGAGLLSSFGELQNAFSGKVKWRLFDLDEVRRTPFDYSSMQSQLFIVPSFSFLRDQVLRLADRLDRHKCRTR